MKAPEAHVLSPGSDTGPCAVFVHGIEDSWRTWSRVAVKLGPQWRCVSLDMPWNAGNDYRWRWKAGAGDWVRRGLDAAVGDRQFVLIGHSFGANAVLSRLSAGEPRATAVMMIAPFYRPAESMVTWETFDLSRKTFERQIGDGMRARLREAAQPDVFEVMLTRTCERIGPTGFLAVFEQYVASGHLELSHVDVPALILVGERDPGMYRPHLEELAKRLPRAMIASGPQYDHFCHVTRAGEVSLSIKELAIINLSALGEGSSPCQASTLSG